MPGTLLDGDWICLERLQVLTCAFREVRFGSASYLSPQINDVSSMRFSKFWNVSGISDPQFYQCTTHTGPQCYHRSRHVWSQIGTPNYDRCIGGHTLDYAHWFRLNHIRV